MNFTGRYPEDRHLGALLRAAHCFPCLEVPHQGRQAMNTMDTMDTMDFKAWNVGIQGNKPPKMRRSIYSEQNLKHT